MSNQEMTEYKPRPIENWLERIHDGRIALPYFQRSYVWGPAKVCSLLAALLTDRPVGSLLSIKFSQDKPKFEPRHFFALRGRYQGFRDCKELILDGQQRLTSLYQALDSRGQKNRYFVEIEDWDASEIRAVYSDELVRKVRSNARIVKSAAVAKEEKLIPIDILGIDNVTQEDDALHDWCLRTYADDEEDRMEKARKLSNKIRSGLSKKILNRNLWYVRLPEDTERAEAIEIYIRTNQSASLIKPFDIATAAFDRIDPEMPPLRRKIEEWTKTVRATEQLFSKSSQKKTPEIGELIFKIACLQKEKAVTQGNYADPDVIKHLHDKDSKGLVEIEKGLEWLFGILADLKCFRKEHIPSAVPLRVIPALHPIFKSIKADLRGAVMEEIIPAYLWRSFVGDRYEVGVNTKLKEDYEKLVEVLKHIIENGLHGINEKIQQVPIFSDEVDVEAELSKTIKKQVLPRSLLLISMLDGAYDFASNEKINKNTILKREKHHIFPQKFLKRNGVSDTDINHPMNFALIESETNKIILDHAPKVYIQERFKKNQKLTDEQMRKRIESHMIPYEILKEAGTVKVPEKYREFIEERAKRFEERIKRLTKVPFWN